MAAPPPAAEPGGSRRYAPARLFLRPRCDPARRLDRLPDGLHGRPQLLRPSGLRRLRRDRQLQDALHDLDADTAIKNNADLGRGRARVRDRDRARSSRCSPSACRWAVAFKTVVFLPMAISAFATGVTWRIMYQQDPNLGAVNALGRVAVDAVTVAGRALRARCPSTPGAAPARRDRARAEDAAAAGRRRPARAHRRSRPRRCRRAAKQAVDPTPKRRRRSSASSGATSSPAAACPARSSSRSSGCRA